MGAVATGRSEAAHYRTTGQIAAVPQEPHRGDRIVLPWVERQTGAEPVVAKQRRSVRVASAPSRCDNTFPSIPMAQSTSLEPITPVPDLSPRIPVTVAEAVENRFYSCRSISWRRWSGWLHPIKGLTGFRTCSLDQTFLLPPSLQDWLLDHHQARFLADVVDSLDLRAIYSVYERKDNRGIAAFHL